MSFRTTGILAIILVLLGAYYYFFEVVKHEEKEQQKEAALQVFDFETDSVDAVTVKNQYGEFQFQKVQGEWRITKPLTTGADESLITSALNSLKSAKKDKEFSVQPDSKKDYGLGSSALEVTVTLDNGATDSLFIGDKTPVGSSVFAAKGDTMVYTVPQNVQTSLDKKLFDWRNKNLLKFQRNDVQRLVIHRPDQTYEFEKAGSSDWTFSTIERPGNTGVVNGIISKLENNKAKAFVDEEGTELSKYGLKNPRYQVDLYLGEEKGKKSLAISNKINNKYYAKDESRKPIFEIDSVLVKDIRKSQSDFRDKNLLKFDQNAVDRVVIQTSNTMLACIKDTAGEWSLDEPEKPLLKKNELTRFLSTLRFSNISEFVADGNINPGKYGLKNPDLEIQIYNGEEPIADVKFGNTKNTNVYAMTDEYDSVYLLPKTQLNKLKLERSKILAEPVKMPDSTNAPTK